MSTLPAIPGSPEGAVPAHTSATVTAAVEVIAEALAPATRRAYASARRSWESPCAARRRQPLPASPADRIAWLTEDALDTDGEPRPMAGSCTRRLSAMPQCHRSTLDGSTGELSARAAGHVPGGRGPYRAAGVILAATMHASRWSTPKEVTGYARHLAAGKGAVAGWCAERGEA